MLINDINIFFLVYTILVPGAVLFMTLFLLDLKDLNPLAFLLFISGQNDEHIGIKTNKKRNLAQVC